MSKPWVPAVLATLGGLLHSASLAPGGAWWMQLLALALLVHAVSTANAVRAAFLGWLFGVVWLTSSLWWVFISMHRYGNMPAWAAMLATAALGAGLALYYAIATGGWAMVRSRLGAPPIAFAAFWLLAELARGTFFSGFPWAAGGYAHTSGPLTHWAPWAGVYGISLFRLGSPQRWHARGQTSPPGRPPRRALLRRRFWSCCWVSCCRSTSLAVAVNCR